MVHVLNKVVLTFRYAVRYRYYLSVIGSHFIIPATITHWKIAGLKLHLIASEATEPEQ